MYKNKSSPHPADRQTPCSISDIVSNVSIADDQESWDFFELKPAENVDEAVNRESSAQTPMVQNS